MRVAMQRQEWEHACCNLEVPTHIQPPLYSFSLSIMSYLLSISSAQARFLGTEAKGTAVPIPGEFIVSWRAGYSQRKEPGVEKTVRGGAPPLMLQELLGSQSHGRTTLEGT